MAQISTYDNQEPVTGGDKWIGTRASDGRTRNFTADTVLEYIRENIGIALSISGIGVDNTNPSAPVIGYIYVKADWFGAVPDGETDSYEAIQTAVDSEYTHITIGQTPDDVYVVSRPILVPSNKVLEINGTVIIQDGYQDFLLANVAIGDTTVTVTDADTKYFAGQQVCLSSTAMTTQGGQTGQTRKFGEAFYVESVDGDTITLSNPTNFAFTTANSAKIGHCQNVFLIQGTIAENKSNISITGIGVIDQNRENQYDVEPVSWNLLDGETTFAEDSRFGCGITAVYSNNIFIGGGLTVRNTVLHGVTIFNVDYFGADRLTVDGAHDKNLLIYYTQDFTVTNSRFLNADYEDGVYLHNDARRGFLSNIYVENCSRRGIGIGNNSSEITIEGATAKDCGRAGEFINSSHCSVKSFKSIGGGKDRYLLANRPMFTVQQMVDSDFDLQVTDSTLAQCGITIIGATTNCSIKAHIADLLSSESLGTGIIMGVALGQFPSNILIHDTFILRNKVGLRLDAGCTNIRITDSRVIDNTTAVTNNISSEFKSFNTEGISTSVLDGTLSFSTTSGSDVETVSISATTITKTKKTYTGTFGDENNYTSQSYTLTGSLLRASHTSMVAGTPTSNLFDFKVDPTNGSMLSSDDGIIVSIGADDDFKYLSTPVLSSALSIPTKQYVDTAAASVVTEYPQTSIASSSVTWTGTAPTGTWTGNWQGTKAGKHVTVRMNGYYSGGTGGTGITAITIPFPAELPAPANITGFTTTNDYILPANGRIINTPAGGPSTIVPRAEIRKTASSCEVVLITPSTSCSGFYVTFDYWTT